MEKLTFDGLPEAVALLLEKVSRIERLLDGKSDAGEDVTEILTSDEAIAFLGISRSLFYKLTSRREFPLYKPGGKKIFVKRSELVQWVCRNRISSQEEIEKKALDYVTKHPLKRR